MTRTDGVGGHARPAIDTTQASPARMYDYYLDGKDNYPVDRTAGEAVLEAVPHLRSAALANRRWLYRVVRYLAENGITQFLDIGTGIPTTPNTHQIAQAVHPEARVVYVDNDPIVMAYARALLSSGPEGRTGYIEADLREPERILADEELWEVLDRSRPVALLLVAVLHFVEDSSDPLGIVGRLMDALPSGSFLAVSHATGDFGPEAWNKVVEIYRSQGNAAQVRSRDEVAGFFSGLDLVEPGLDLVSRWRPPDERTSRIRAEEVACYGGLGRKP
ncbi:SAM-dependent methyltransferase [Streptomyces sp. FXJ1.4098]|nr:SAM-dependent methyltransferase [Streptomyces sp. FXJ1.4098]